MAHHHSHQDHAGKNISVAFFLNLLFVCVEIVGGLWTNSIAILTDALHDFGDCLSLATAWFLQKKSIQERNNQYSYGYKRFSLLGSIFLSGVLVVSSIFVVVDAALRLTSPQTVEAQGMLWLAIAGIVINGAAAFRMKKGTSLNEHAVFLHIMEDVLGWVAVLVVSIVMLFVECPVLDPLLSIGISIWVLRNVYKNLRETFRIMLQGVPEDVSTIALKTDIQSVQGVISIHDFHLWSLDGESHVMTLHVVTSSPLHTEIKENIIQVAEKYHIVHTTIEFELPDAVCKSNCDQDS